MKGNAHVAKQLYVRTLVASLTCAAHVAAGFAGPRLV